MFSWLGTVRRVVWQHRIIRADAVTVLVLLCPFVQRLRLELINTGGRSRSCSNSNSNVSCSSSTPTNLP